MRSVSLQFPTRLRPGDCIGIVAPSSPEKYSGRVERGVRYLENKGYRVIVGKHVGERKGYLAGSDANRADDLSTMFANREIRAILCTRGGYGAGRILPFLDWKMIRRNPKIFVGFSDGTALNLALLAKARLITFTGALPGVDLWKDDIDSLTEKSFWRMITVQGGRGGSKGQYGKEIRLKSEGKPRNAKGILMGGNLALTAALVGTPYFPKIANGVWVLEDVAEEPYRIDRMLWQLQSAGVFTNAAAIVFGQFSHCEPSDPKSQYVEDVIRDVASRVDCPVFTGLPYGHVSTKITLPIGGSVVLEQGRMRIL